MNDQPKRTYLWLFAILAVVGLCADQASKYVVFAKLYPATDLEQETRHTVIPALFDLRTLYMPPAKDVDTSSLAFLRTISGERMPHVNRGALFGIGNGNGESEGWNRFFTFVSLAAACFIVFWVARPMVASDRFLCLALGLILGGTLGNLYDRVVFDGVRDFLHWYYGTHVWPDFNIADCCLVCGAGTLLVHSFFAKDPATEAAPAEAAQAEAPVPMETTSPTSGA